jgi:ATP-binding cassette, subfamily B, bacterial
MYFDPRLWAMTVGVRGRIALASLIGLLGLPVSLGRLVLSGIVIAAVLRPTERSLELNQLIWMLVAIGLLILLRAGQQLLKEEIANRTASEMKIQLRSRIYAHVLKLGPGPFDQRRTGDVLLSLVEGVEQLETFFGLYLPQLIVAALTPVILFGLMAFLDLPTAIIFLVFSLLALVMPSVFHSWNADSSLQRRKAYSSLGADFLDGIQGLATLKTFGQSRARGLLLAEHARELYRGTMAVLVANCATGGLTLFLISAGAALALATGALRVEAGQLPLQTLVIVLMLGVEVFRPLRELAALYHRGMVATSATNGIYTILDSVPDVTDPVPVESEPAPKVMPALAQASAPSVDITFEHVSFAYPGRDLVLDDVSFTLRAGETLGLVGPSGAGKSTTLWLLLRFFDPQQGRILLGGRDLRELPLDELRRQFAVVTQDTYLFHGTVADNLRFGKAGATQAELEAAARVANAHDFIADLPDGYETIVGERGARLSGGQRQRIAIARALLKNAPILLLDEALSSVDSENEAVIQEAFDRLQLGRTTLVIAHRLSSVINADRTLVLDDGRLVETGSHRELVAAGGVYAALMAEQAAAAVPETLDDGDVTPEAEPEPVVTVSSSLDPSHHHDDDHDHDHSVAAMHHHPSSPSALSTFTVWQRLLDLVRPWWGELGLVLFLGLARAFAVVGLAVVSALLVGQTARQEPLGPVLTALGLLVPLTSMLTWIENWKAHDLAYRLLAEMRIALFDVLDPLAPAYFQRRRSGDLASAMTGDVELIEYFFAHTIAPAFVAVLVPGAVLVGLALIAPPLALVLLPFIVLVGASPFFAQRAAERIGEQTRGRLGDLNAQMVDSVQGLRTVVAFQRGPARLVEIEQSGRRFAVHQLAFLRNQAMHNALIEAATGFGGLAVMVTGLALVSRDAMPRTLLPLATVTALAAFSPVTELAKTVKQLAETLASARRIFLIHDEPVPVVDGPGVPLEGENGSAPARKAPALRYEAVSFAYEPGLPPALNETSFRIEPGQTVAVVGRSGAGKTTAAHLVLRFWDPQSGRITLDGHDLRDYRLDELRRQVAVVAQDTYLFNMSVRDNLLLAKPTASQADLERACQLASVHDFIASLPEGYGTTIGERGFQLSGGQRQRLAIARALLADAPVLILDEATSHLDAVNERQVHVALEQLIQGRTTMVIAHRLSTVRRADLIVVLDRGTVVEQGTHDELLAQGGLYAQLVGTQLAGQSGARNGHRNGHANASPTVSAERSVV